MDNSSLADTKWNCKYHIVFALKYKRQIIYGKIKEDISRILRKLCEHKGVEIIEANACLNYICCFQSNYKNYYTCIKREITTRYF